jgi:hypothetical protein
VSKENPADLFRPDVSGFRFLDTAAGNVFDAGELGLAADTSASRPIGFDLGYGTFGLASVNRCGLGRVCLQNKFVSRPLPCSGRSSNLKTLAPAGSTGRGRAWSWGDFGYGTSEHASLNRCQSLSCPNAIFVNFSACFFFANGYVCLRRE